MSDEVRAAQETKHDGGADRRHQQSVVKVGVVYARQGQEEANVDVDDIDDRQKLAVSASILGASNVRVLDKRERGGKGEVV